MEIQISQHCYKPVNVYMNYGLRICQACHIDGYLNM